VHDTTAPELSDSPADAMVECNAIPAAAALTATDNCDPNPTITFNESRTDGSCADSYILTRTWTATDHCGNHSSKTQVITVHDTTAPDLSAAPADTTVECNAVPPAAQLTASDNCDPNPSVTFNESRANGTCADNYTLSRTWTATDRCGNHSSKTQVITVHDTTAPTITQTPQGRDLGCNPQNFPNDDGVRSGVTASDNCSGSPTINVSHTDSSNGCNRSRTFTITAMDRCGNTSAPSTVVYTWKEDTTPPVFTFCPAGGNLGCNPASIPGPGTATATDNCGTPTITSSLGSIVSNGCNRSQTRTYTATDACGNSSTCTQVFNWVVDTTRPTITCPANVTVACGVQPVLGTPTVSDNCGGSVTVTNNAPPTFPTGTTTVTWTARDACGNTATCTQTVTVGSCESHCALTQGAYGNPGGYYTYNGTRYTTTQLLQLLTSTAKGGSLVVGNAAASLTIPQSTVTCLDGDNACGFERLPGNGGSAALPWASGNKSLVACSVNNKGVPASGSCQTSPALPLQGNGGWQNVLLGQTVTLTLNTRLDPSLLTFVLPTSGTLCTQNGTFPIPATVLTALNTPTCNGGYGQTVRGLLYLANRALAGQSTCGASLTDITNAVGSVNNAFDSSNNAGCPRVCM
jgi:hypothetical protein